MPEHRLDKADVGPVLQHVRGHGMPEQMTGAFDFDAGLSDVGIRYPGQLFDRAQT